MNNELEVTGTQLTTEDFMDEYNNRSEEDNATVEMISSETDEIIVLSEEEFKELINNKIS